MKRTRLALANWDGLIVFILSFHLQRSWRRIEGVCLGALQSPRMVADWVGGLDAFGMRS